MDKVRVIKKVEKQINNTIKKDNLKVSAYIRVSTKEEEQLNSFESQTKYYTDAIKNNSKWELYRIYADEGISGTQVKNRDEFQRMIRDALNGEIDLIITKSISRFARNTVDTLKYVRLLKENNVAVFFEKENINTLDMGGEVLLTILSSLAQQESESISANVKMGVKMKMKRGEMVGGGECLGYDYDKETQTLTINKEEAKIIKYIFKRYIEGAGSRVIANELTNMPNCYTLTGKKIWNNTTILRIIRNEKYVGDLLLGKYITVDSITHRVIENMGEEEQYYVQNHHEAIVDREIFDKAQEILNKRSKGSKKVDGTREKYSRKYAFSSITKCGFCGSRIERRVWHPKKPWKKYVWMCSNYNLNGKQACPHCKGIDERLIEEAFIQTFNQLQENNMGAIKEFIQNFAESIKESDYTKEIERVQNQINDTVEKLDKLVDMKLNNSIDDFIYKKKHNELSEILITLRGTLIEIEKTSEGEKVIENRIRELQKVLYNQKAVMKEFDRDIFDKIVDNVILGDKENGKINPYTITFKLKSGLAYFNEIIFDEERHGGRDAYPYSHIKTPISGHMNILYMFDFSYDFGNDGKFKKEGDVINNVKNINVKITI